MTTRKDIDLFLGASPAVGRLKDLVRKLARRPEPVLIQGPTGSGKELVARALHSESGRRGELVAFNVCAIPDTMFEDSLFGHVRGAFTGAATDAPGYLLEAHGGTVFLDELSGLHTGAQAKLLRAIETSHFRPVGARADRASDFRLVASVNEPIERLVQEERLRRDLLHRLSTFVLEIPPLKERLEDIEILAPHFATQASNDRKEAIALSSCALRVLKSYDWPGNVRELRNVVVGVVVLADGPIVTSREILPALTRRWECATPITKDADQRSKLLQTLVDAGWDTAAVAQRLGVDRATVYRRMRSLGIERGRVQREGRELLSRAGRDGVPRNANQTSTVIVSDVLDRERPVERSVATERHATC